MFDTRLFLALIISLTTSHAYGVYKCVGANGDVTYQTSACPSVDSGSAVIIDRSANYSGQTPSIQDQLQNFQEQGRVQAGNREVVPAHEQSQQSINTESVVQDTNVMWHGKEGIIRLRSGKLYTPDGAIYFASKDKSNTWHGKDGFINLRDRNLYTPDGSIYFPWK